MSYYLRLYEIDDGYVEFPAYINKYNGNYFIKLDDVVAEWLIRPSNLCNTVWTDSAEFDCAKYNSLRSIIRASSGDTLDDHDIFDDFYLIYDMDNIDQYHKLVFRACQLSGNGVCETPVRQKGLRQCE